MVDEKLMSYYLSEDETVGTLINYLDNSIYNYAVMIDGGWGSGKTHFAKNKLIEALDEHEKKKVEKAKSEKSSTRKVIYTSAYGITDPSEISSQVLLELSDIGKKVATFGRGLIPTIIKNTNIDIGINLKEVLAEVSVNFAKPIIIVDDIERSNCDINQLFGYINSLVEHSDIKVALISNETEIDDPDGVYERIKEKLIGMTIKYAPDFGIITESLINDHIAEPNLKKALLECHPDLVDFWVEHGHNNIRSFQFFLSKIDEVYSKYLHNFPDVDTLLPTLLEYYYKFCMTYKMGDYKFNWEGDALYGSKYLFQSEDGNNYSQMVKYHVKGFKFIDEHILFNKLNKEEIYKVLTLFCLQEKQKILGQDDPFNRLGDFFFMEDDEIKQVWEHVFDKIKKDQYSISSYEKMIRSLAYLVNKGFEKKLLEDCYDLMTINICNTSHTHTIHYDSLGFDGDEEVWKLYKHYMGKINDLISQQMHMDDEGVINEILESDTWGESLYNYVKSEKTRIGESFLKKISIPILVQKISAGSNENIARLIHSLHATYGASNFQDFYKEDTDVLHQLLEGVRELDRSDFGLMKLDKMKILESVLQKKYDKLTYSKLKPLESCDDNE